ncbi:hypothetical protein [Nonomuraea jabiensis]|uniref:Uncharacterized protein n=1 Tax=Nonomuraea jabiensis TaxID=882448 RepID=A0A7W9GGL2_9ACTN|nr:hypothetical protein [Nonomuraea jabiensis]MBB5783397.1 hypothetical protein [Nonomuraea jabiensis]
MITDVTTGLSRATARLTRSPWPPPNGGPVLPGHRHGQDATGDLYREAFADHHRDSWGDLVRRGATVRARLAEAFEQHGGGEPWPAPAGTPLTPDFRSKSL